MLPAGDTSAIGVVDKMFSEIDRVLKLGGRYIWQHLVDFFADLVS